MKFSTRAGSLADALSVARQALGKTTTLVAYTGVHLVVKAGELTVTGSDGETTVTAAVPVTKATAGQVLIPPKPIATYLATFDPATELTVDTDGAYEVVVTTPGGSPYRFRSLAESFPTPAPLKAEKVPVDFRRLPSALAAVNASSGKERLVQLVSGDAGLQVHTTDGYRLTRAALPEAGFGPFSGLLRLGVLEQIARAHVTAVQVDPRGRVFAAFGTDATLVTRLVDERFPAVGTVLDGLPPYSITLPSADLRMALSRLAAVTETTRPLHVKVDGTAMLLDMDSVNIGSGDEQVTLSTPAPTPLTFGVNLDFLAEAVGSHPAAELTLSWSEATQPIFLSSADPLPITGVVMPVRL